MKSSCVFILILMVISDVIAITDDMMKIIDEEELRCCSEPSYLISDINAPCFDPVKNVTTPNRIGCITNAGKWNFTIKSGVVEYYNTRSGLNETVDSAKVCYGDVHLSKNSSTSETLHLLLICDKEMITKFMIYNYTVITSVTFMSITAVIYAIFRELRDVFGMSVTNFCGSFAVSYVLYVASFMNLTALSCIIKGYLVYFFLLAAFFWSNAISIQALRDTRRTATLDRGWKEFRWYCLYSWGVPAILTTIMAIVEHYPGDHEKPGFAIICWFSNTTQEWYYLNGVLSILLIINLAIFIYIAVVLWRSAVKKTYLKTLRYKISMTVRLILVMGLPWIFKMLRFAVGNSDLLSWFFLEMITAMQGILIFLLLVVRKKVVRVLHQRGLLACCSRPVERWLAAKDDESCEIQHSEDLQMDEPTLD